MFLSTCFSPKFVYGDPIVTEESLALIVHIIFRAVVAEDERNKAKLLGQVKILKTFFFHCHSTLFKENMFMYFQSTTVINIAEEPVLPKVDPAQCTEAFLQATNREAELDAMQFADAEELDSTEASDDNDEKDMEIEEGPSHIETDKEMTSPTSKSPRSERRLHPRKPPQNPLKWDISIVACPYKAPVEGVHGIFNNLATWLTVKRIPNPTVVLSPVEENTVVGDNGQFVNCSTPKLNACKQVHSIF